MWHLASSTGRLKQEDWEFKAFPCSPHPTVLGEWKVYGLVRALGKGRARGNGHSSQTGSCEHTGEPG